MLRQVRDYDGMWGYLQFTFDLILTQGWKVTGLHGVGANNIQMSETNSKPMIENQDKCPNRLLENTDQEKTVELTYLKL